MAAWVKQFDLGPLEVIFFCRFFSDDKKIASGNTTDWAPLRWNLIQILNFMFNCADVFTVFYGTEISHVPFVTSPRNSWSTTRTHCQREKNEATKIFSLATSYFSWPMSPWTTFFCKHHHNKNQVNKWLNKNQSKNNWWILLSQFYWIIPFQINGSFINHPIYLPKKIQVNFVSVLFCRGLCCWTMWHPSNSPPLWPWDVWPTIGVAPFRLSMLEKRGGNGVEHL